MQKRAARGRGDSDDALLSGIPELYVDALRTAFSDVAGFCGLPEPPPLPADSRTPATQEKDREGA